MYSKNDYRDYLEHRLAESDDFLAHYGVKGMKWRKRKNSTMEADQERGKKLSERYTNNGQWLVRDRRPGSISVDASYRDYERTRRTKSVGTNTKSLRTRVRDKARRIRMKRNASNSIFDKSVWKRSKPKGKKLSKKSNITVSHNTTIK